MKEFVQIFDDSIQLEDIFDHALMSIVRMDIDEGWLSVDPKFCQTLGCS
jgi:hypothetical protein